MPSNVALQPRMSCADLWLLKSQRQTLVKMGALLFIFLTVHLFFFLPAPPIILFSPSSSRHLLPAIFFLPSSSCHLLPAIFFLPSSSYHLLPAMSSNANMETLLHLVPTNQVAHNALLHPDNQRFVSSSTDGRLGLEIGFHVSSKPQGHVITRLGRNADLILQESTFRQPMSAIHAAFEINPTTHLVVLSVRSKRVSSVRFTLLQKQVNRRPAEGIVKQETDVDVRTAPDIIEKEPARDDVIHYGQNYHIVIASYWFDLIWRTRSKSPDIVEDLKTLTFQGYQSSLQRLKYVRSRDRPTEYDGSGALSWHVTRLSRLKGSHIQDVKHRRHLIGLGSYGQVYRAVDQVSGNLFAIKIVNLGCHNDIEAARAVFHREVKIMEKLKHVSCVFAMRSL